MAQNGQLCAVVRSPGPQHNRRFVGVHPRIFPLLCIFCVFRQSAPLDQAAGLDVEITGYQGAGKLVVKDIQDQNPRPL